MTGSHGQKSNKMKKIILATAWIFIMVTKLLAQDTTSTEIKTLIGKKTYNSGYIALSGTYTKFNKENAVLVGAYGGWLINHRLLIGMGGYGNVSRHAGFGTNPQNTQNRLRMGYGGLVVEYTFMHKSLLHITAGALVGAGAVSNGYKKDYYHGDNGEQWRSINSSAFFVAEPSVKLEMNVSKDVRIAAGGGYRYIREAKLAGITDLDMRSLTASLSLKVGLF
jgi:hypothetical protein